MVVGPPPYPGLNGCFLTHANQDIVFIWAILIIWDARKCEYAIQCVHPLIEKAVLLMLMLVPAIQACAKSLFCQSIQRLLIFSISDRDGEKSDLTKAVYRDGKSMGSPW